MSTLIQLIDRPIAYNPALAKLRVGKVKSGPVAAVFLSQLIYWHNRTSDAGGWIYKTQADIASETALTRDEQETARRRLVALGVLEEERRGANGRLHFRIKTERLEQLLTGDNSSESDQPQPTMRQSHNVEIPQCGTSTMREPHNVGTPHSGMGHSRKPEWCIPAFPHTEITTENTTENINPSRPGATQPDGADTSKKTRRARLWGTEDDHTCAHWIWDRICSLYPPDSPPRDPNWDSWANDIRLLRERDGRTHRQICELFDRVNRDQFWSRNVLSPGKLREKWDDLTIRLMSAPPGTGPRREAIDLNDTGWLTPELAAQIGLETGGCDEISG